jgi:hypothetical protein
MAGVWTSSASCVARAAAFGGAMALLAVATPARADWHGPYGHGPYGHGPYGHGPYYGHQGGHPGWGWQHWGGGPRWGVVVAPPVYPRPYYPPPPVYYAPPPVYYAPPPVYYAPPPPPVMYAPSVALGLTVR